MTQQDPKRVAAGADQPAKAARESAERETALFRSLVETAPASIFIWRGTRFCSVNAAMEATTGYSTRELLGMNFWEVIHPDCRDFVKEQGLARLRGEPVPSRYETKILRKDGEERWADLTASVIDFEGQPAVLGIAFDITERKQAEEALRDSEKRLRAILNTATDAIITIDQRGIITGVNLAAGRMFGYTQEELVGQNVKILMPPPYSDEHEDYIARYLETGEAHIIGIGREAVAVRKDGSVFPIDLAVSEVDHLKIFTAIVRDISDRKQLEREIVEIAMLEQRRRAALSLAEDAEQAKQRAEQAAAELIQQQSAMLNIMEDVERARQDLAEQAKHLERANAELAQRNRDLDEFAYVASHDLRSPLRAIHNLAQWIAEDQENRFTQHSGDDLKKLRRRVVRMDGLLDGLLHYSRVGRKQYPVEVVDTGALVREIVELLGRPDQFTIDVADEMPTIKARRIPLEQVLQNLIDNAIKHHDRPNGRVVIAAQDNPAFVEFAVSDDGPGIAAKYQQQVFKIFETIKAQDQVEGSGMGLALVKKIVETHGGRITLESDEGKGATFRFTWPKESGH